MALVSAEVEAAIMMKTILAIAKDETTAGQPLNQQALYALMLNL